MSIQSLNVQGLNERYLQFSLGTEYYAIDLLSVQEVIPLPDMRPLPNAPAFHKGIVNLRGNVISIIDIREKLNIKSARESQEEAVIITTINDVFVGLIVDSIDRVLSIPNDKLSEVPEVSSQLNSDYIESIYHEAELMTVILKLKNILNIPEIKNIEKKTA